MTTAQEKRIENIVAAAQKSFCESQINKEHNIFEWEVYDPKGTHLCFLTISTRAKPGTGLLFMTNQMYSICLGKRGGVKDAKLISGGENPQLTAYYVRRGIFAL